MIKDNSYFIEVINELKSMGEWNLSRFAHLLAKCEPELAENFSFYLNSSIQDTQYEKDNKSETV
jgi:hypothetical protein